MKLADGVLKEPLVGEMHQLNVIHKEREGRYFDLGCTRKACVRVLDRNSIAIQNTGSRHLGWHSVS